MSQKESIDLEDDEKEAKFVGSIYICGLETVADRVALKVRCALIRSSKNERRKGAGGLFSLKIPPPSEPIYSMREKNKEERERERERETNPCSICAEAKKRQRFRDVQTPLRKSRIDSGPFVR